MKIIEYLPEFMQEDVEASLDNGLEEIRIRIGQQVELMPMKRRFGKVVTVEIMDEIMNYLTDYSRVSYEEQLKRGYFTIEGGYRIGVAGAVNDEGGIDISAINIRIARQFINCSRTLLPYIKTQNNIYNTLIASGPGVGKTTYLRDCVRNLSYEYKVGIVDERSEIGALSFGVLHNDLGPGCDVMGNCKKSRGMTMLLRSMSPQIIAVDEIGDKEDYEAIEEIMNCGVKFIGTVHAGDLEELKQKRYIGKMMESRIVERLVFLEEDNCGERSFKIFDCDGRNICSN